MLFLGAALCGVTGAILYIFFTKRVTGAFIRALIDQNCCDENSAKTPEQLGFGKSGMLAGYLKRNSARQNVLFSAVSKTGGEPARYYIAQKDISKAKSIFGAKGADILTLIISVFLIAAFFAAVYLLLPYLL